MFSEDLECGNIDSSIPTINTYLNSSPLAECKVINCTASSALWACVSPMSSETELKNAAITDPNSERSSPLLRVSNDLTADISSLIFSILILPFSPLSLRWCSMSPLWFITISTNSCGGISGIVSEVFSMKEIKSPKDEPPLPLIKSLASSCLEAANKDIFNSVACSRIVASVFSPIPLVGAPIALSNAALSLKFTQSLK